jgi:ADP-ribose pyrophosphatase
MSSGRTLETRTIWEGPTLRVAVDRVRLPNGEESELEVVHHPGAAAVLPLLDDGDVLLVRQYRHSVGEWLLEVPAGKLAPGERPESCALRELEEEAGVRAGRLQPLGAVVMTPGFCDERIWLFLATGLTDGEQRLERDEVLRVERLPLAEAERRALDGEIHDAKSVCAILRAARLLARGG